jgi:hypothetical protein
VGPKHTPTLIGGWDQKGMQLSQTWTLPHKQWNSMLDQPTSNNENMLP